MMEIKLGCALEVKTITLDASGMMVHTKVHPLYCHSPYGTEIIVQTNIPTDLWRAITEIVAQACGGVLVGHAADRANATAEKEI